MASLTLREMRKNYGEVEVIHGVDLDINDGEFVVFVGPSGCGKSTLLRSIAGLEILSGGSVHLGERDITSLRPQERTLRDKERRSRGRVV